MADATKFLGRRYCPDTNSWVYSGNRHPIHDEERDAIIGNRKRVSLIDLWPLLGRRAKDDVLCAEGVSDADLQT